MDREETIALWQRCEDAREAALADGMTEDGAHEAATAIWNGWANELLGRKAETRDWRDQAAVDFSGLRFLTRALADAAEAQAGEDQENDVEAPSSDVKSLRLATDGAQFRGWIFPGDAGFGGAQFSGEALFRSAQFSGAARFGGAQFGGAAGFGGAQFGGEVGFRWAQFSGAAGFDGAQFSGAAVFQGAQFGDDARFDGAQFGGAARFGGAQFLSTSQIAVFSRCHFAGYTSYKDSLFRAGADFDAIRAESTFDLAGATFEALPGFIQANFKEPPRFDHLTLKTPLVSSEPKESLAVSWRISLLQRREWRAGLTEDALRKVRNTTSKFRALKVLAIKAYDGEREHLFFKGEMRARRISEDEGRAVFWGNIAYDLVSDFGRSFLRPFALWTILLAVGVGAYWWGAAADPAQRGCDQRSVLGYSIYLSVRDALVLLGSAKDQRVTEAYLCLFGPQMLPTGAAPDPAHPTPALAPNGVPDIPGWITAAEMAHVFLSIIAIFLIGLALRNQFKIK